MVDGEKATLIRVVANLDFGSSLNKDMPRGPLTFSLMRYGSCVLQCVRTYIIQRNYAPFSWVFLAKDIRLIEP